MNPMGIILWINRIYAGDKALRWCHNEVYNGFLDLSVQRVWRSQKFYISDILRVLVWIAI